MSRAALIRPDQILKPFDARPLAAELRDKSLSVHVPQVLDPLFLRMLLTEVERLDARGVMRHSSNLTTFHLFSAGFLASRSYIGERDRRVVLEDFPVFLALSQAYAKHVYNPVAKSRVPYVNYLQINIIPAKESLRRHPDTAEDGRLIGAVSISGTARKHVWSFGGFSNGHYVVKPGDLDLMRGGPEERDRPPHEVNVIGNKPRISIVLRHALDVLFL